MENSISTPTEKKCLSMDYRYPIDTGVQGKLVSFNTFSWIGLRSGSGFRLTENVWRGCQIPWDTRFPITPAIGGRCGYHYKERIMIISLLIMKNEIYNQHLHHTPAQIDTRYSFHASFSSCVHSPQGKLQVWNIRDGQEVITAPGKFQMTISELSTTYQDGVNL